MVDSPLELIVEACKRNCLAHCYLLAGTDFLLKSELVKKVVKFFYCKNSGNDSCPICVSIDNDNFFALTEVSLENNPEKKQSIGVEYIKEIRKNILASEGGIVRVYFFKKAQDITEGAANMLLKTLEESADNIYYFFDCLHPYSILPTIRSRSQIIYLGGVKKSNEVFLGGKISQEDFLEFLINTELGDLLLFADKLVDERKEVQLFLDGFNEVLVNLVKTQDNNIYIRMLYLVEEYRKKIYTPVSLKNCIILFFIEMKELLRSGSN